MPAMSTGTAEDDGDEAFASAADDEDDDPRPRSPSASAEQALRKECGFSQMLVDDLKAYRHQITRAHLAANFDVAFDLALYALASICSTAFATTRVRSICARPRRRRAAH